MNSGTRIKELQNAKENKRLLAAQRQTYTDAKRVDFANACICLLVPLGITVAQAFLCVPTGALVLIWVATFTAGICLPKRSERLVEEAAAMQQRFDSEVFGIKFENVNRDDTIVASRANRYYEHGGADDGDRGLDDWYSVEIGDMRAGDAIARCQRQNAEWTMRQFRRSICIEACIALLVAVVLAALIAFSGVDILNFFFLFTIVEWIVQRFVGSLRSVRKLEVLENALSSYRLSSRDDIVRTQDKIFEYRKAPYLVPDWLYSLFKRSDETATAG